MAGVDGQAAEGRLRGVSLVQQAGGGADALADKTRETVDFDGRIEGIDAAAAAYAKAESLLANDAAKAQIAKLIERQVPLMACPGCLKAAGKTAADLAPGIRGADKEAFFGFTKGRILTLDY